MAVSNPEHRAIGTAARKTFNKGRKQPGYEYVMTVRGVRLICWTNTGAPGAMLNVMFVQPVADGMQVTYLQVTKDSITHRGMTRHASPAELERWFAHFPDDRKLLSQQKVS